jgi:predicted MFS family arabinose efflux permease
LTEFGPRHHAVAVVLITTGVQMAVAMANIVLATIAPAVAQDLGVDPAWVGYQVSLLFGAATLSTVFGGAVVLRWGAGRASQMSVLACALGLMLFALPHLAFIAIGSVAVGAGMGLANPAAAHLLVRYTAPERRNLIFSVKQTGVPLGGVVTALTAPALAVTVGWRWSLAMITAYTLVLFVLGRRYQTAWDSDRDPGRIVTQRPFSGVAMVWREGTLRWISLVALVFSIVQRSLLTFTVIYLVVEGGYGLVEAGVMLSVAQIAGSVSRVAWGWLADRMRSSLAVLTMICVITTASMTALFALDASWPRLVVYFLFFMLGMSALGWNGVFHAECARLSPTGMASLVAGGTTFFVFAGVLLGPALFAAAYQVIGSYGVTFGLMAAVSASSLALLALAVRATRRAAA